MKTYIPILSYILLILDGRWPHPICSSTNYELPSVSQHSLNKFGFLTEIDGSLYKSNIEFYYL
jgi:hypothetical protein